MHTSLWGTYSWCHFIFLYIERKRRNTAKNSQSIYNLKLITEGLWVAVFFYTGSLCCMGDTMEMVKSGTIYIHCECVCLAEPLQCPLPLALTQTGPLLVHLHVHLQSAGSSWSQVWWIMKYVHLPGLTLSVWIYVGLEQRSEARCQYGNSQTSNNYTALHVFLNVPPHYWCNVKTKFYIFQLLHGIMTNAQPWSYHTTQIKCLTKSMH